MTNPDPKIVAALNRCGETFIRAQEARANLMQRRPLASVEAVEATDADHESALCDLRAALYAPPQELPEEPRVFRVGVNY